MFEKMRVFPRLRGGLYPFVIEAHRGGGSTFEIIKTSYVNARDTEDAEVLGKELFQGRVRGRYRVSARRASCHDLGMEDVNIAPSLPPDAAK